MSYGAGMDSSIIGQGQVHATEKMEHLNSVYLSQDRTINSVPYYARKKQALQQNKRSNASVVISIPRKDSLRGDLKNQISDSLRTHKMVDPYLTNYIKELTVEPVLNTNQYITFNEADYPLTEDEKVRVVEEKYFSVQNYYNYIYEEKIQQEVQRFAGEADKEVNEAVHKKVNSARPPPVEEVKEESEVEGEEGQTRTMRVKGQYASRFDPGGGYYRQRVGHVEADQMAPVHRKYQETHQSFMVKEKERKRKAGGGNEGGYGGGYGGSYGSGYGGSYGGGYNYRY